MSVWATVDHLAPSSSDLNELSLFSLEFKDEALRILHNRLFEPICLKTFHLNMCLRLIFISTFGIMELIYFKNLIISIFCGIAILLHLIMWIVSSY
jgi:hypothetical protein